MSFHFLWYVERDITPHGLRVMALRSWRTLICHLEAPKDQSNQSGLRDFNVNPNLVQYLLQTDIQKRAENIQWQIQTLHRDFSSGNPNRENQHILYSYNCVTLFTIQYTYRSQRHPKS